MWSPSIRISQAPSVRRFCSCLALLVLSCSSPAPTFPTCFFRALPPVSARSQFAASARCEPVAHRQANADRESVARHAWRRARNSLSALGHLGCGASHPERFACKFDSTGLAYSRFRYGGFLLSRAWGLDWRGPRSTRLAQILLTRCAKRAAQETGTRGHRLRSVFAVAQVSSFPHAACGCWTAIIAQLREAFFRGSRVQPQEPAHSSCHTSLHKIFNAKSVHRFLSATP